MHHESFDSTFQLIKGVTPLIISIPHGGELIPEPLKKDYNARALQLDDTDWHLGRLYDFGKAMGASIIQARYSRYVIDLNRPSDDRSLYPGQTTTGLFPRETFSGAPLYPDNFLLTETEKKRRLTTYWLPYHTALRKQIEAVHKRHGYVLLWDAHSIRSCIPRLFEGVLPDFNIGTNADQSAEPEIARQLAQYVTEHSDYTAVANGRFKGGYITRHYGNPAAGIHAIQLELAQKTYMLEKRPYPFAPVKAEQVAPVIKHIITEALSTLRSIYEKE